jgi:hypothetical protein
MVWGAPWSILPHTYLIYQEFNVTLVCEMCARRWERPHTLTKAGCCFDDAIHDKEHVKESTLTTNTNAVARRVNSSTHSLRVGRRQRA